ncbi:MAG TPA: histidine phosphatase family protein [Ktedonobacteraceae bacterium]|nr:histidine phosphatase family protein [Ktedonobacteraceae bacterium]
MRLLLVRHGATPNNIEARYTGQSDVELSVSGLQQAKLLAARLAAETFDAIVSSDLRRSLATAQAVADYHGLSVWEDADLREFSLGAWEEVPYAEVKARDAALLDRWRNDPEHTAPPGGETGAQVRDRILRALERWQAQYPKGTVLWVTHGGTLGVLLCHLLGMELRRRNQFRFANASITELKLDDQLAILKYCNDTAHLRDVNPVS